MDKTNVNIEIIKDINLIEKKQWNLCACPEVLEGNRPIDPFTTYNFISALENSGSVGKGTGWHSCHLIAKMDKQIIAVMPLYLKGLLTFQRQYDIPLIGPSNEHMVRYKWYDVMIDKKKTIKDLRKVIKDGTI